MVVNISSIRSGASGAFQTPTTSYVSVCIRTCVSVYNSFSASLLTRPAKGEEAFEHIVLCNQGTMGSRRVNTSTLLLNSNNPRFLYYKILLFNCISSNHSSHNANKTINTAF